MADTHPRSRATHLSNMAATIKVPQYVVIPFLTKVQSSASASTLHPAIAFSQSRTTIIMDNPRTKGSVQTKNLELIQRFSRCNTSRALLSKSLFSRRRTADA